jgi:hypothetical protein
MNENSFLKHIENTRDCGASDLDTAVQKGLNRAKRDRLDSRKLLKLAADSVFTLAVCFMVSLEPFGSLAKKYYQNWNHMMPGVAEALDGYIKIIADNLFLFLGRI